MAGAERVGAKGNEGVAGQVRSTPGAIGYVELAYVDREPHAGSDAAEQCRQVGRLHARDGVAAAAATKPEVSADELLDRRCEPARTRYPISGYSWVVVYKKPSDAGTGKDTLQRAFLAGRTAGTIECEVG